MADPSGAYVEIVKPDGYTFRWDGQSDGGSVPQGLTTSTKRMEGFSSASCTLRRRIDRDHPDIELFDDFNVLAPNGAVIWEGRVSAHPRQLDLDGHQIQVEAVGHMVAARDRKFRMPYVDRDLSRWQPVGVAARLANITSGYAPQDPTVVSDSGDASLLTRFNGSWTTAGKPLAQGWYDAGDGVNIGALYYRWKKSSTVNSADANWFWDAKLSDDDLATTTDDSGNLRAAGPGSGTLTADGNDDRRYALVRHYYDDDGGGDGVEYDIHWVLGVYGDHGLETHDVSDTDAPGVYASDVLGHIVSTYCPTLNAAGVTPTTYPIPHLAFNDQTDPYDAMLEVNKFHLWDLAVWEGKTLHYGPVDLTDYDWEIREDDEGVSLDLQGDTAEGRFNGVVVEYDEVTKGRKGVLTPADHDELADTSEDNPVNRHGLTRWTEVSLSSPTTEDAALQIGRALLAEANQAKQAGSISVGGGFVRNRQGVKRPAWEVRAGETIAITDYPNSRPRLISETSWSADSKVLTVAVDSTVKRIDAFLDRVATSLSAAGIAA